MSRRLIPPVTSRVKDETTDRILRNHDERIRELQRLAQQEGRRWRVWAGAALQPVTETQDISRSSGLFIFNAAGTAVFAPDNDTSERIVAVHALVDAAAASSISMRLFSISTAGGFVDVGGEDVSSGTAVELLSLTGLSAGMERNSMAPYGVVFVAATAGDRVNCVAMETEPA